MYKQQEMSEAMDTRINNLKKLNDSELSLLCKDIRSFLIESISTSGGHIGANLAVVELTACIHFNFNSPEDKIIFDTGHQGYTHKILTGRKNIFPSLNKFKGMNRFISRDESEHDIIDASHAGTSISIAAGYAEAMFSQKSENYVVCVIGDGSLTEGMAFEGLNYASSNPNLKLIIIVNDNEMAIARSVGGFRKLSTGEQWQEKCKNFFNGFGYEYAAVANGHNVESINTALNWAKQQCKPTIIHVKTQKGFGLDCASEHPYKMHFSMPFNKDTGAGASPTVAGRTYAVAAAESMYNAVHNNKSLYVLTAATPYASNLDALLKDFPSQVLDVGMAEQHLVGMACGLSLGGNNVFVCAQTTFLQRAYDQINHDMCYMNLPVTILGVRSGFAGYDGATHHGIFDISYLRSIPNLKIVYPINSEQLNKTITDRAHNPIGPMLILYPYDEIPSPEPAVGTIYQDKYAHVASGNDLYIICLCNQLQNAWELRSLFSEKGKSAGIICIQSIKPFPITEVIEELENVKYVITLEESILAGGLGTILLEGLSEQGVSKSVYRAGINDEFIPAGNKTECCNAAGILATQVITEVNSLWPNL